MNVSKNLLEEYLDGELPAVEVQQLESVLKSDAAAKRMLAELRRERATRAAALDTYAPPEGEARQLAGIWLDEFKDMPIGTIRPAALWSKRIATVAAGLLLAFGSFYMGQRNATPVNVVEPTPVAMVTQDKTNSNYIVVIPGNGAVATKEFASYEEAEQFAQATANPPTEVASGVF